MVQYRHNCFTFLSTIPRDNLRSASWRILMCLDSVMGELVKESSIMAYLYECMYVRMYTLGTCVKFGPT